MAAICTIKVGIVESATYSQSNYSTIQINNNADTTVLGSNCLPIHYFERLVYVSGWDASAGSVEWPIISGSIAYYHPISGQVYMLVYHQAIHCPRLTSHLMCSMQSRISGVIINELPKFFAEDPDEKIHAIIVDDPPNQNEPLIVLLAFKGVPSYFSSRDPIASEYKDESIPRIDMTSEALVWEPSDTSFSKKEGAMNDFRVEVNSSETIARGQQIINSLSTSEDDAVNFTDDENFYNALNTKINVARVGASKGIHGVTLDSLSQKWLVSPEAERRTLQNTTHRGIRMILHPSLSRLFHTNEQALRYNRLQQNVFNNTIQEVTVSRRLNWYAQVYSTGFGWSRAHPMKIKGDAHETLSLFFKRDGVPHNMVMYGSKEQNLGSFRKKCQ